MNQNFLDDGTTTASNGRTPVLCCSFTPIKCNGIVQIIFVLAVIASFIRKSSCVSFFQPDPQHQPQTYQQEFVEMQTMEVPEQQATSAVAPVIKQVAEALSSCGKSELEQQVAELKLQVENQQAVIAGYRSHSK